MISIDEIVDEEMDLSDQLENVQESISNLVSSIGRYSPGSDMLEALMIIKKLRFAAELAILEANLAIDRKIKEDE